MNIRKWIDGLNIHPGSVVSIVGCGGKTTLLESFAQALSDVYRVCVATTTRINIPKSGTYTDMFIRNEHECKAEIENPGIYYFSDEIIGNKMHEAGAYMVSTAKAYADILLIEADGSREKPVKAWTKYEPVIIEDTTLTIGIVTLKQLGCAATKQNVHRLQCFEKLTGIKTGEVIQPEHICQMVNDAQGMFKGSRSKKVLLINQIDNEEEYKQAIEFIENNQLNVDDIFVGSLKNGRLEHCKR